VAYGVGQRGATWIVRLWLSARLASELERPVERRDPIAVEGPEEVLAFMTAVESSSIHLFAFFPLSIPYCPVDSRQCCLKDVGIQTVGNCIEVRVRNDRSILA